MTGRYRHYKGADYDVVCLGTHADTLVKHVVYRGVAGGATWVRPLVRFTEDVKLPDGRVVPRFTRLEPQPPS